MGGSPKAQLKCSWTMKNHRGNYSERLENTTETGKAETWGVLVPAMPQVNQRTKDTDTSNTGTKILPFRMCFVEKEEEK